MNKLKKASNILIGFVLLIAVWQALIIFGKYDEALFPSPLTVWKGIVTLIKDGTIFTHFQVSFMRFLIGYLLAVVTAVILGLMLGRLTKLWDLLDPIVQVLRPVSPIAWSPLLFYGLESAISRQSSSSLSLRFFQYCFQLFQR